MQSLQHFGSPGTGPDPNLRKTGNEPAKMMQLYGKSGMAATDHQGSIMLWNGVDLLLCRLL
jgi:hypothetical protein